MIASSRLLSLNNGAVLAALAWQTASPGVLRSAIHQAGPQREGSCQSGPGRRDARAWDDNIELGLLVRDPSLEGGVVSHFQQLIRLGDLRAPAGIKPRQMTAG